jgi:hypothetical protein
MARISLSERTDEDVLDCATALEARRVVATTHGMSLRVGMVNTSLRAKDIIAPSQ